jgi:hypothetical protein
LTILKYYVIFKVIPTTFILLKILLEKLVNEFSKKIFFLYPYDLVEQLLIKDIITHQYEAYIIKDHTAAHHLLTQKKQYNNSILLLNFNKYLKNLNWNNYIDSFKNNPVSKEILIKGFSHTPKETLHEDLHNHLIPCQVDNSPNSYDDLKTKVLTLLESQNAKGQRKYIRIQCNNKYQASCSIKYNNNIYLGEIRDISIVGLSCIFYEYTNLIKGTIIKDLQIRLNGKILKCSAKHYGYRIQDNKEIHILLFEPMLKDIGEFINSFLYRFLQEKIDQETKQILIQAN